MIPITTKNHGHPEYREIIKLIEPNSTVLDLGCGSGRLLKELIKKKNVRGRGIDIAESKVIESIKNGVSVSQGDIDQGLHEYPDNSYDYVILSRTLQALYRPHFVLEEMLRVGTKAIVMFPNFGYWRVRTQLMLRGRMPKTKLLPYEWYDTPNIHSLTINDFRMFCEENEITIDQEILLTGSKRMGTIKHMLSNLLADEGLYVLTQ